MKKVKDYYQLTKPGIIRGNLFTALGGFFLASYGTINWQTLLSLTIGIICVIGAGCVFNNILDRKIDSYMERTKNRALVTGRINSPNAFIFGLTLFVISFISFLFTTTLALAVALIGIFSYVVVYGYFKRKNIYGTLVGSISGATPPVVGYVAVTNSFDLAALLLFLILVAWQMPHFYAIGIFRKSEYEKARIPLFTIKKPFVTVRKHTIFYMFLFTLFVSFLTLLGFTGYYFLFAILLTCWFWLTAVFADEEKSIWSKKIFGLSLVVLLVFSVLISVDFIFPF